MTKTSLLLLVCATTLGGCAATVTRSDPGPASAAAPAVRVPAELSRNVVVNVTGSDVARNAKDWEAFRGEWRQAMSAAAAGAGAKVAFQDGAPRPAGQPGTLVVVDVGDYRYITPAARFGFGVMTGNAYVNARVRFLDLRNGAPLGERTYNTSSSAWQGIFSAMTDKQLQALGKEIFAEINPR